VIGTSRSFRSRLKTPDTDDEGIEFKFVYRHEQALWTQDQIAREFHNILQKAFVTLSTYTTGNAASIALAAESVVRLLRQFEGSGNTSGNASSFLQLQPSDLLHNRNGFLIQRESGANLADDI
jgi:hypothetical protein